MNDVRIPQPGDFYLHFKNKLYQIITIAMHSETRESLVIYQALYGDYKTFARPLDMFISEVDHNKYPEVTQKYRFQYLSPEDVASYTITKTTVDDMNTTVADTTVRATNMEVDSSKELIKTIEKDAKDSIPTDNNTRRKTLMDFLDANDAKERLEIFGQMKSYMDQFTLDSIAVCLDYVPTGNTIEDQYESICQFLHTKINYESIR